MRKIAKSIDYFRRSSIVPRRIFYPARTRENLSPPARRPYLFYLIRTRPEPPVSLHHPCPARPEQIFKKLPPPARHHGAPRGPRGETRDPHTSDTNTSSREWRTVGTPTTDCKMCIVCHNSRFYKNIGRSNYYRKDSSRKTADLLVYA